MSEGDVQYDIDQEPLTACSPHLGVFKEMLIVNVYGLMTLSQRH